MAKKRYLKLIPLLDVFAEQASKYETALKDDMMAASWAEAVEESRQKVWNFIPLVVVLFLIGAGGLVIGTSEQWLFFASFAPTPFFFFFLWFILRLLTLREHKRRLHALNAEGRGEARKVLLSNPEKKLRWAIYARVASFNTMLKHLAENEIDSTQEYLVYLDRYHQEIIEELADLRPTIAYEQDPENNPEPDTPASDRLGEYLFMKPLEFLGQELVRPPSPH
jgi:hypothetical protein